MSKPLPIPPPGFDELPVEDQIDYVQTLWDRIAADPRKVPVPQWHRELLRERLRDLEENPGTAKPWDEVRERLRRDYGSGDE